MSLDSVLEHVAAIDRLISNPASLVGSAGVGSLTEVTPEATGTSSSTNPASFAAALEQASADYGGSGAGTTTATSAATGLAAASTQADTAVATTPAPALYDPTLRSLSTLPSVAGPAASNAATPAGGVGQQIVSIAESQVGQAEQPLGSNESPAIAQYRTATVGAIPGAPWCAYFASWVARQAGEPLGSESQGLGSVAEVWSWAQSTGRAVPNGPGVVPKPGDLIVFGDEHVGIVKDVLPNGQIQTIEGNYDNRVSLNVRQPTEATGYVSMS